MNGKEKRQQKQTNENAVSRHSLHPQATQALFAEGGGPQLKINI
jgi:hypothetical protein